MTLGQFRRDTAHLTDGASLYCIPLDGVTPGSGATVITQMGDRIVIGLFAPCPPAGGLLGALRGQITEEEDAESETVLDEIMGEIGREVRRHE